MSSSSSSSNSTISDEDAKKLGKHATAHHPLAVHGMAKASTTIGTGFSITSSSVTKLRHEDCELRVTLCRGDLCEMKKSVYGFRPPIPRGSISPSSPSSLDESAVDRKLSEVRAGVCAPNPLWLLTDPLALIILITCGLLAIGTLWVEDLPGALHRKAPRLESIVASVFGSGETFSELVRVSFWFSVVAHLVEAVIAFYYSRTVLGLGFGPTAVWFLLVFAVGYPVFSRIRELVAIETGHAKCK